MVSRVGIVGLGWWGQELLRCFREFPTVDITAVCKRSPGVSGVDMGETRLYIGLDEFFKREVLERWLSRPPSTCYRRGWPLRGAFTCSARRSFYRLRTERQGATSHRRGW